ncbi:hypothetical protein ADL27_34685, partial [Streptomyces sp. NRRL F-6602]
LVFGTLLLAGALAVRRDRLPRGARVWAKREDVNSPLAFGGNKTRKLEYLIPDALKQGADTLVTIGGVQSNHTRQVAAVAARLGLKAVLVQESWVDWPDPVNDKVGTEAYAPLQVTLGRLVFGTLLLAGALAVRRDRLPRGARVWAKREDVN